MKSTYHSVRFKISAIVIIIIVIIDIFLLFFYSKVFSNNIDENLKYNKEIITQTVQYFFKDFDSTFSIVEAGIEKNNENAIEFISMYYNKYGNFHIENEFFEEEFNNITYFILDDKEQLIFSNSPYRNRYTEKSYIKKSNFIKQKQNIITHDTIIEENEDNIIKYSYKLTKDKKYFIVVILGIDEIYSNTLKTKFNDYSDHFIESNIIQQINIYDSEGKSSFRGDNGLYYYISEDRKSYLISTIQSNKPIEFNTKHGLITNYYYYIPYNMYNTNQSGTVDVIEIVMSDVFYLKQKYYEVAKLLLVSLFIIIFSFIFIRSNIKRIMKPLSKMVDTMGKVSQGKLNSRVHISSNDEFKIVGQHFNSMLEQIEKQNTKEIKLNKELKNSLEQNKTAYLDTIKALMHSLEAKDYYTLGHSTRVAYYALLIAKEMNMSEDELTKLEFAALLHDIGKIGIPENILNKAGKLSDDEYTKIKQHPQIAANILEDINFLKDISIIILQHHERVDGKGYPYGIKNSEIHSMAKILSIADCFDAMTSDRAYRGAYSLEKAIEELNKNKNYQFDSKLVSIFIKALSKNQ